LIPLFDLPEARILFDPGLSAGDLCAHFFNCVTDLSNNGHPLARINAEAELERGMRLFLHGTLRS